MTMIGKMHIEHSPALDSIPQAQYEGYVWMSDKELPNVLEGRDVPRNQAGQAFIQEALLWDAEHRQSIHVRHVGHLQVVRYDMKDQSIDDAVPFLSHRIAGHARLKFKRTWVEEIDPACAGMTVMVPGELIFVGFGS